MKLRQSLLGEQMTEFVCHDQTCLPVEVKISQRAKSARIQLSHQGLLTLVFPKGSDTGAREVNEFIEKHHDWIERAAIRTRKQRQAYQASRLLGLPVTIRFPVFGELWHVEYVPTTSTQVRAKPAKDTQIDHESFTMQETLRLSGNVSDVELCRKALLRFLDRRANSGLPMYAHTIMCDLGVSPPKMPLICNRKTAWGACTSKGQIRLDRKLLFLPKELVKQVVLHETAHLKHLNHSRRFYNELYSYPSSSKENEVALKTAVQYVPAWAIGAL